MQLDEDVDQMSQDRLIAEVKKLRAGIRAHRDSSSHDLCWHHPALWGLLPEQTDPVPTVPTWPEFLAGCIQYRNSLDKLLPSAPRASEPFQSEMLARSEAAARLPAQDLTRAKQFYSKKLGLEPIEERPGGLCYQCGSGYFSLFQSAGKPSGNHTQMGWEVDDIDAVVQMLRARGVVCEEYDLPGLKTVNGIARVEGHYPSRGKIGERAAWFRDSEGNLLGMGQPIHETE